MSVVQNYRPCWCGISHPVGSEHQEQTDLRAQLVAELESIGFEPGADIYAGDLLSVVERHGQWHAAQELRRVADELIIVARYHGPSREREALTKAVELIHAEADALDGGA